MLIIKIHEISALFIGAFTVGAQAAMLEVRLSSGH